MINQRITKLRQLMKERGIDLYIIPTSDFHQSEYVGSYFEARHYMSGFSGSAGTLIVREDGQTVVILFKQKKNLPIVVSN